MRHQLLIIIWLFIVTFTYAQNQTHTKLDTDSSLYLYTNELKLNNIDTFCIYSKKSITGLKIISDLKCDSIQQTIYIYWIKNGNQYLKKITPCCKYEPVNKELESFWSFIYNNIDSLKKEVIAPFQYIKRTDWAAELYTLKRSHFTYVQLFISIGQTQIQHNYNTNPFSRKSGELYNINFKENSKLKIKQVIHFIEKSISHVNNSNLFITSKTSLK